MTMERSKSIAIVEDDASLMLGLDANLQAAGYRIYKAGNGLEGRTMIVEKSPDLVLLDVMLPDMSGLEVCQSLRAHGMRMPIMMLTARQEESDKLAGFAAGADDYVTKPFSIKELLARIRAMLAREERTQPAGQVQNFGDCVLDGDARVLRRGTKTMNLTRTEFALLAFFLANEGKALGRDVLMRSVWGVENLGTQRSLDTFVAVLRGKIEKSPAKPKHILTVHGVGYKFCR